MSPLGKHHVGGRFCLPTSQTVAVIAEGLADGLLRRPKLAFEPTDNLFGLEGIKPFALLAS